ncbi:hypothetical protein ABZV93_04575 [Actinopolymorpha sp. NPDC004070]|uniref:hypothetical protein n=1 Tax=Actinopolymorpha sp. NPDC004070 TaxID=3154548 RepID=UPI0033B0F878
MAGYRNRKGRPTSAEQRLARHAEQVTHRLAAAVNLRDRLVVAYSHFLFAYKHALNRPATRAMAENLADQFASGLMGAGDQLITEQIRSSHDHR